MANVPDRAFLLFSLVGASSVAAFTFPQRSAAPESSPFTPDEPEFASGMAAIATTVLRRRRNKPKTLPLPAGSENG